MQELLDALRGVRYWANCSGDNAGLFDPMDIDVHSHRPNGSAFPDELADDLPIDHHLGLRDGRFHPPVLRGDTINFRNIDGPQSLMTAWKKLAMTSPMLRRESEAYL